MSDLNAFTQRTGDRRRGLQALVAGANAWLCGVGFPWLFLEQPTALQSTLHAVPLLVLLLGVGLVVWARTPSWRTNAGIVLVTAFPLSVGVSIALRDESINRLALPAWALLLCVVSLWVFVAVLAQNAAGTSGTSSDLPVAATRPRAFIREKQWWLPRFGVLAAVLVAVVAPRWLSELELEQAWGQGWNAGALLVSAAAIALAVGLLVIVLGPAAGLPARRPSGSVYRRVIPSILATLVSALVYMLTRGT